MATSLQQLLVQLRADSSTCTRSTSTTCLPTWKKSSIGYSSRMRTGGRREERAKDSISSRPERKPNRKTKEEMRPPAETTNWKNYYIILLSFLCLLARCFSVKCISRIDLNTLSSTRHKKIMYPMNSINVILFCFIL